MTIERNNPWELYSDMKGWRKAHNALEAAWKKAAKMPTEKEAWAHMDAVMEKYAEFGACDTEPRCELRARIEKRKSEW